MQHILRSLMAPKGAGGSGFLDVYQNTRFWEYSSFRGLWESWGHADEQTGNEDADEEDYENGHPYGFSLISMLLIDCR